ncbi:hypothetical protein [Nocardioides solisilvae]|nr:hypothetical protein [Nocardioides solisilvae]
MLSVTVARAPDPALPDAVPVSVTVSPAVTVASHRASAARSPAG